MYLTMVLVELGFVWSVYKRRRQTGRDADIQEGRHGGRQAGGTAGKKDGKEDKGRKTGERGRDAEKQV